MTIDKYLKETNTVLITQDAFVEMKNIMRKYQKIEQILKSLDDGEINYPQMAYYLREVIEDGNTTRT